MPGYVDENLIRNERVVYRGTLSAWAFSARILLGILLIPFVVGIVILAGVWIFMRSAELAITNKRVIVKFGWLRRDTMEMNLARVESVQVDQTMWGRLFNYGSIQINGTGTSHAPVHGVADPLAFRRAFMEVQDEAIQGAPAGAVVPPVSA